MIKSSAWFIQLEPLKDIKLTPRDPSDNYFTSGKMTLSLGKDGNPVLIEGGQALEQDVMKAVFTGVQPDGYGTVIHRVIGEKNTSVVKTLITFTITTSLQRLLRIHNQIRRDYPLQFRGRRCLQWVDFIHVQAVTATSVHINVDFRTRENEIKSSEIYYSVRE